MLRLSLLFLITMLSSSFAQNREANPEDVSTVDGVMNAYYEAVSGPPGKRDFKRIQTLYLPGAKLNVNSVDGTLLHGLVEEVLMSERFQTISTDFYEREISRDEHRFGDMANVISTYGISDAMANTDYTA
ncbi:MAG: hypothetical protein HOJ34_03010, partial [Kordiimonadaceae bacterium]|nr:hypothetical protein [Kordiimonadaceae bacterium]